jgi:hypothetical protein
MKVSMRGQEKGDLLIKVTVNRGDHMDRFDCILCMSTGTKC